MWLALYFCDCRAPRYLRAVWRLTPPPIPNEAQHLVKVNRDNSFSQRSAMPATENMLECTHCLRVPANSHRDSHGPGGKDTSDQRVILFTRCNPRSVKRRPCISGWMRPVSSGPGRLWWRPLCFTVAVSGPEPRDGTSTDGGTGDGRSGGAYQQCLLPATLHRGWAPCRPQV